MTPEYRDGLYKEAFSLLDKIEVILDKVFARCERELIKQQKES